MVVNERLFILAPRFNLDSDDVDGCCTTGTCTQAKGMAGLG